MADIPHVVSRHRAMATHWELLVYGRDEDFLDGVALEVWREIDRLEEQLSFYRETSDITDLNLRAAYQAVPLEPRLFRLLEQAKKLSEFSEGAFDITVAPLVRCWGFAGGGGHLPSESEIEAARAIVGMQHVHLDAENRTVWFDREGVTIELGAIGKGFAVDCAVEVLQELEIESALLHGGTSSVFGLGTPPGEAGWPVAIRRPKLSGIKAEPNDAEADNAGETVLTTVLLQNAALSVSAPHGKWFEAEGRRFGHVLDPRTGYPTGRGIVAALVTPRATEGDALSTALLTNGADWLPALATARPEIQALLLEQNDAGEFEMYVHAMALPDEISSN